MSDTVSVIEHSTDGSGNWAPKPQRTSELVVATAPDLLELVGVVLIAARSLGA